MMKPMQAKVETDIANGLPGFEIVGLPDAAVKESRERVRAAIKNAGLDMWVQVDGGVSRATIEMAAEAGANNFVAGSAVFKAEDAAAEVDELRRLAHGASH